MEPKSRKQQSPTRKTFWQHHVKHWQDSGLSKRRYCLENELAYHQLIYWCEKSRQVDTRESHAASSSFIGVALKAAAAESSSSLSVELPNGLRIIGIDAENLPLVPRLLSVL